MKDFGHPEWIAVNLTVIGPAEQNKFAWFPLSMLFNGLWEDIIGILTF